MTPEYRTECLDIAETIIGFDMVTWFAILVPMGTSPDVVDKLALPTQ